jgi:hypothetical protein
VRGSIYDGGLSFVYQHMSAGFSLFEMAADKLQWKSAQKRFFSTPSQNLEELPKKKVFQVPIATVVLFPP